MERTVRARAREGGGGLVLWEARWRRVVIEGEESRTDERFLRRWRRREIWARMAAMSVSSWEGGSMVGGPIGVAVEVDLRSGWV